MLSTLCNGRLTKHRGIESVWFTLLLLRNFTKLPLCFRSKFSPVFSGSPIFCHLNNLRTPQPIVFKFLSVNNYGHEKITFIFQRDPKLFRGGGLLLIYYYNLLSLLYVRKLANLIMLSFYGIFLVMIDLPYNWSSYIITFHGINQYRYTVICWAVVF